MTNLFESMLPADAGKGDRAKAAILHAAALEFGERGLEGARTREIAVASGQNLGSLHYYFGSKEELYLTLAERAVAFAGKRLEPVIAAANEAIARKRRDPDALRGRLIDLLDAMVDTIVGHEETLPVSVIMMREQIRSTAAFEIFYGRILGPIHEAVSGLLARYTKRSADDPLVVCRAHALLGQVFIFRAARATICRRANWSTIAVEENRIIRDAIRSNLVGMIGPEAGVRQKKAKS